MKLLIDMNLSPLWVRFLDDAGFASIHWSTVGSPSAPDTEILKYAAENRLVIFTHDLDFGALLAKRRARQPSVIQVRTQQVLPADIGDIVVRALRACGPDLVCCRSDLCEVYIDAVTPSAYPPDASRRQSRRGHSRNDDQHP